ncbi:hypothetical protein F443_16359 [Phytophthora nicotianae P1569]|uniref:HTH psq-type domain-containing protein n=2 Tax=Phytophthora nicotianae TaxID=4792 RepID=V9EI80_PHYNI|nr:hypothetical protein F443_16359 [Phytophthora nicotianae P1569]
MPTFRRSYSIAEKVSILSSYDPGAQGSGFHALGHRHDISPSTIRGWWSHKEELQAALRDRQVPTVRCAVSAVVGGDQPKMI